MTPKRKEALQWFCDHGEVDCNIAEMKRVGMYYVGRDMIGRMLNDGHLRRNVKYGHWENTYTLTDKGRRALNGDDV